MLTPTSPPEFARWPHFEVDDVDAGAAVLRSGRVNYWGGDEGRAFEREFAAFVQTKYGIAAANGTCALEMALHGLGIQPGDEVIVPSRTFVATAAAVVRMGGVPVCADIDRDSGNVTAETIANEITDRTRGVIAVHMAGWPCDMDPIMQLADEQELFVIEDCAQAHGATYKGRPVGSIGDAGAFSFCQDKIMTTAGEGGFLATNREDVFRRAWLLKDHGRAASLRDPDGRSSMPISFGYFVEVFGGNMRISEVQAAVGRSVLRKLPSWLETRRRYADRIADACRDAGLRVPLPEPHSRHVFYRVHAYVEPRLLSFGWTRDRVISAIRDRGVPCLPGSCFEIYREPAFAEIWGDRPRHPVAQELAETSLAFLVHPTLSDEAISYTCEVVESVMTEAMGQWALRTAA